MPDIPQAAETPLTSGSILKLVLTTAVATGIAAGAFNQSFAWIKETIQRRQKDRQSAKVFTLELVELLTRFARECNERAGYNRYDKDGGGFGRYSKMPILAPYPEGAEWGLLPAKIAAGLRDLRVEVDEASGGIEITAEVIDPGEAADTATYQYVVVGYMALELSDRLRRHYGFGRRQRAGEYDFASELRKQFRLSHVGPVRRAWRRLWNSPPVIWARRRSRLWRSRITKTLRQTRAARLRA
jgi:hypothetical protein